MIFFTIGYGGRAPKDFLALLTEHRVRTVADIRITPQRASMGSYVLAKSPEKGIQELLKQAGIDYTWVEELGNPFRFETDWEKLYRELVNKEGRRRIEQLLELPEPICLLCCEKKPEECHRALVAELLVKTGHSVRHIR